MTALELLTVLCAVAALGAAVALSLVASRLLRASRRLESATREFEDHALPAVKELRDAARGATAEVHRVDDLLEVAGAIGQRVDSATEATYRALTSPVIKGVALASGTRRAAGRLRGRDGTARNDTPVEVVAVGRTRSRRLDPAAPRRRRRGVA